MTRRRRDQSFTKRDATRALKAAQAAGIKAFVEIDTKTKTIRIIPDESLQNDGGAGTNPWDEVLTDAQDQKRSA